MWIRTVQAAVLFGIGLWLTMHCAIGANSVPERSEAVAYSFKHWEIDLARRELRANGRSVPLGGRAFEILEVLARTAGATSSSCMS